MHYSKDTKCSPQVQTSSRTYKQSKAPSEWSDWSPKDALFETCIGKEGDGYAIFGEDQFLEAIFGKKKSSPVGVEVKRTPLSETRVRFKQPLAADPQKCENETQVRSSGATGLKWMNWTGSFKYTSCAESQIKDLYRQATAKEGECIAESGIKSRECDAKTGEVKCGKMPDEFSGTDFDQTNCIEERFKDTYRESGFELGEDFSALNGYACTKVRQTQKKSVSEQSWDAEWTPKLDAAYSFATCDFPVLRVRWSAPVALPGKCSKETQTRKLEADGTTYSAWSGSFRYEHCMEKRSRYNYDKNAAGCKSIQIYGWRLDGSDWFGDPWLSKAGGINRDQKLYPYALRVHDYPYHDCDNSAPQVSTSYVHTHTHTHTHTHALRTARTFDTYHPGCICTESSKVQRSKAIDQLRVGGADTLAAGRLAGMER